MSWYQAVKDAVTAANKLQDADLIQRLATVQVECAALAEENARLREERNELRATLTARAEMVFDQNVYWWGRDKNREGPYCPKCWDGDGKTARLAARPDDHYWRCSVCELIVERPGAGPERQQTALT